MDYIEALETIQREFNEKTVEILLRDLGRLNELSDLDEISGMIDSLNNLIDAEGRFAKLIQSEKLADQNA